MLRTVFGYYFGEILLELVELLAEAIPKHFDSQSTKRWHIIVPIIIESERHLVAYSFQLNQRSQ
jgi:hypothetical protein